MSAQLYQRLSALPDPLYKENTTDLTVTIQITNVSGYVSADTISTFLLYAPRLLVDQQAGSKVPEITYTPIETDIGQYTLTISHTDFDNVGTYSIRTRAFVDGELLTADSQDFYVQDFDGPDFQNPYSDSDVHFVQQEAPQHLENIDAILASLLANIPPPIGFQVSEKLAATTDSTETIIDSLIIPTGKFVYIKYWTWGFWTNGTVGNPGDSLAIERTARIVNINDTLYLKIPQSDYISQDRPWHVKLKLDGNEVQLILQGEDNASITWNSLMWTKIVG